MKWLTDALEMNETAGGTDEVPVVPKTSFCAVGGGHVPFGRPARIAGRVAARVSAHDPT